MTSQTHIRRLCIAYISAATGRERVDRLERCKRIMARVNFRTAKRSKVA